MAAVKSAKFHFKHVVRDTALNFEEMYTVLTLIEAVMNLRPLTPLSCDLNDFTYLIPSHFLVGNTITAIPQHDVAYLPINRLSRWQRVSQIHQHFWSQEYLQQLQQTTKWQYSNGLQLNAGDMVLINDNNASPSR